MSNLQARIENNFSYHSPKADQQERYTKIRADAKQLAETIANNSPESREQSLALTNLEQAIMLTNASIARNE